ncbi:MAG TPA: hypothetical protein DDZ89_07160 [Clostridiales bacterium]|nr:hypothetical protein [Clostridiales bacterium]
MLDLTKRFFNIPENDKTVLFDVENQRRMSQLNKMNGIVRTIAIYEIDPAIFFSTEIDKFPRINLSM